MKTICYVGGCGRLGLSLAVWSAECGYQVLCADVNEQAVAMVNRGQSPIQEPMVDDLVRKHAGLKLFAMTDVSESVSASSLIFVIVPTPSEPDGSFSLKHILEACGTIGAGLATDYKVVVIVSTVMPGHTDGPIRETLEAASGKKAGRDFGLVYSPEFIRQGTIVQDFANPSQILIGQIGKRSGDVAEVYYRRIVGEDVPVRRMSLVSAEIAKLGLNVSIVQKMAASAQITWLCQYTLGADARDVLCAVAGDPRIGSPYFEVALWPGGPCFPRDTLAFAVALENAGTDARVAKAVQSYLWVQAQQLTSLIERKAQGKPVGILGIAYKSGVGIVECSLGLLVAQKLNLDVEVCDPYVNSYVLQDQKRDTVSLESLVDKCKMLVLITPHPQFKALEGMDLSDRIVLDCRQFLDEKLIGDGYQRLGIIS